jgi:catechol 2,3-dioxygenase-like lactoylglutathione lyase family enzyme
VAQRCCDDGDGMSNSAILGIDHVQITVAPAEVEAARAFYCGVLGLAEIEKPEALKPRGGFWLKVGDRQVHVGVEDGVNRAGTKAHVAYRVGDVAAWRAKLQAAGVKILTPVAIPGLERFEFRDPFGNRVEMIGPARIGSQDKLS